MNTTITRERVGELRRLYEAASPGPWFFDSYSTIRSKPIARAAREWSDKVFPKDISTLTDEDWKRLAKEEPKSLVLRVPIQAGDTATEQGSADACFIEAAVNAFPALLDAAEERDRNKALLEQNARDWAEDHDHLQALCRAAGVPDEAVTGDGAGVPGIAALADLLVAQAYRRAAEVARRYELQAESAFNRSGSKFDEGRDTAAYAIQEDINSLITPEAP